MKIDRSELLFAAAQQILPGGVNSPVRAFRGVGGTPRFIERGEGPYLVDVDGNRYIDYVLSWGPLIAGHAHPQIIAAITQQAMKGTSYGAPCELESLLGQRVIDAVPSIEMVRFVSSGTEATMSAVRLARAYTGRSKIVKFSGCYHGHADEFLVQAGSGVATLGLPDSPGVPPGATTDTLTAPYNDLAAVAALFELHRDQIAAVIVEPVAGNMGFVLPQDGFLQGLRDLTTAAGSVLIFDEVMTGFRVAYGGAQSVYGIAPDLTCLGKVIGGGLPAAAYGGKAAIMRNVAPSGPMYQAGTLSGNPLAMAAGLATLDIIQQPGVYEQLGATAQYLAQGIREIGAQAGVPIQTASAGSMWGLFFTRQPVTDYASAKTADTQRYAAFFHGMLDHGVYLAPSQFEAAFVATAHTPAVVDATLQAAKAAIQGL